MQSQTFTKETMGLVNLIESLTKAKIKDLILADNLLTLVTQPGEAGKAIGKAGKNLAMLRTILKKPIKVIEFSPDPVAFTKNIIHPLQPEEITLHENTILISSKNHSIKARLIGRDRKNLKYLALLLQRCCGKQLHLV